VIALLQVGGSFYLG